MAWLAVGVALMIGMTIGIAAVYLIRFRPARIAKDFAEELYRETETQRTAHIESILDQMRASFGALSVEAVTRSTREFVKFAQTLTETEQARAKTVPAQSDETGRQLQQLAGQVERLSSALKETERDRTERMRDLAHQMKALREHVAPPPPPSSDRRHGEAARREVEERFQSLLDSVPMAVAISRVGDDVVVASNAQFATMFGLRTLSLAGHKFPDIYATPGDRETVEREIRRLGPPRQHEIKCKRPDGTTFWTLLSVSSLTHQGELATLHACVDVTEWKQSAERLRGTVSLLNAVLDCTADGMVVVDRNGRIVSYNQKFLHMWRIPESVIQTRSENHVLMYVMDQLKDYDTFIKRVRKLNNDPNAEHYDVLEFKDGRLFERYSVPQRLDNDTIGRVWSYRDATERKWADEALEESEEQLRQSQKMEAIGRLAGGIAHDLNNLLTIITGYSHFLTTALDPHGTAYQDVQEIQQATHRAEALIQQLLAFSRKQPRQPRPLDLNEVLTGMIHMLQRLVGEEVRLEMQLSPAPCQVMADPNQIGQVVMNLLVNARDAMPRGGRVTLETGVMTLDQAYARSHPGTRQGNYVCLAITDAGIGMDAHTLAHCLEPFFTTKPTGQGTGLGLATVYGIVKQSEGTVEIQSELGMGTTVRLFLPLLDRVDAEQSVAPAADTMPSGTETILLVEDDAKVRRLIRQIIEHQGYTVLEASSGQAAVAMIQQAHAIDLLLTDVVMPEMSGVELAALAASARPALRVLYMSGYYDSANRVTQDLVPGSILLLKPFTPDELARKVREALDAPLAA